MMNGFGGGMGFGMGIGWFFWLVIIGGLIWAAVRFTHAATQNTVSRENPESRETALNILKKRYAMGEINKARFEEMREHLDRD